MGHVYILQKGKKTKHTYTRKVCEGLKREGWKEIVSIYGWNMSINHKYGDEVD
jgi:hypothetical protein